MFVRNIKNKMYLLLYNKLTSTIIINVYDQNYLINVFFKCSVCYIPLRGYLLVIFFLQMTKYNQLTHNMSNSPKIFAHIKGK